MKNTLNQSISSQSAYFIIIIFVVYLLQFYAVLYPIFANMYLHYGDNDKILTCETFAAARKTTVKLPD